MAFFILIIMYDVVPLPRARAAIPLGGLAMECNVV